MATSKLGADNTGDSGPVFHILVRICGLAAIAGVFLPFFGKMSIIDLFNAVIEPGTNGVIGNLREMLSGTTGMGAVTNFILVSSYLIFPIIGIYMVIKGKYAGGPFTYLLLFNIAAFLMVNFFGASAGIEGNFFANVGLGYWISCAGLFVPFVGMFFLDKSI